MPIGADKNKSLKLAIAANQYTYGGAIDFIPVIIDSILEASEESGHQVSILATSAKTEQVELHVSSFLARGARELRINAGRIAFISALLRTRAEVVLPLLWPPFFGSFIPWIGYIYDLQH